MNRLFGQKKEAAPKPTMADAQASMEKRSGHLDEKIAKLDKELMRYTEQMKKMQPGPAKAQVQKRAMAILKQKKQYEGMKEKTMNQQWNMDQMDMALSGLKETAQTVSAMQDQNKELKKEFKKMNISKVEDVMDDMEDLLEQAEEVQNAIGRSYNTDDIDEADLEAELAAMESDPSLFFAEDTAADGTADYLDLPGANTAEVAKDSGTSEEEKKLEAAMQ